MSNPSRDAQPDTSKLLQLKEQLAQEEARLAKEAKKNHPRDSKQEGRKEMPSDERPVPRAIAAIEFPQPWGGFKAIGDTALEFATTALEMEGIAMAGDPMLVRVQKRARSLSEHSAKGPAILFTAFCVAMARSAVFGKVWANKMAGLLDGVSGTQEAPKPFNAQCWAPVRQAGHFPLLASTLRAIGTNAELPVEFEGVLGERLSTGFLEVRLIGCLILEELEDFALTITFGKDEVPFSLRSPSVPTIMAVTILVVDFAKKSKGAEEAEALKKLQGLGKRQWWGSRPVFPRCDVRIEAGALEKYFKAGDMELLADWCNGALCDQNHYQEETHADDALPLPLRGQKWKS